MRELVRTIRGAALVGIGLAVLATAGQAADEPAQVLPDADYAKMLKYLAKGIQDALKGSPSEEQATKARTAAVMIAAAAQQNLSGADAAQRAAVRDAALKVAEAIRDKKYAEASKQAGALATLPADASARKEKVKLDRYVKIRDLMNQFNFPKEGGWGIDGKLYGYQLGMKAIPAADLKDQFMLEAYQVALTVDLVRQRCPDDAKQKEWEGYVEAVRKAAVQLADAVKAKDAGASKDAIRQMTTNCTQCHKAFRTNK